MIVALPGLFCYLFLVYKFTKIVEKPKFSDHLSKIAICYNRKGYSIDEIKQSACLAVNPVTVDYFAYLFNCTAMSRGSDSMMAPT